MSLLSESDLNDFISPALACTKPTEIKRTKLPTHVNAQGEYEVGIDDGTEDAELAKVSITLSDCLACSGCITSSEEIMLQQQSHGVFLEAMKNRDPTTQALGVSISPQCRLSMAQHYSMTIPQFDACLSNFFHTRFGATYVVGTQLGRDVCIQQTVAKLQDHKRAHPEDTTPRLSATDPGFVIYTEKTKGDLVPLLLNVKSPQQITGALLHAAHSRATGPAGPALYHLGIMACFDKKLEAARPDTQGEVDCVITPKEVVALLQEIGESLEQYAVPEEAALPLLTRLSPPGWDPAAHWANNAGGHSGGVAFQYVRAAQRAHPDPAATRLRTLRGRNSNVVEHRLEDARTGARIAAAAELSGFRNIQNMVRHLQRVSGAGNTKFPKRRVQSLRKRGGEGEGNASSAATTAPDDIASPYTCDYIEVSAAPGGCINGSGLLTEGASTVQRRQATAALAAAFDAAFPLVDPLAPLPQGIAADIAPAYEYAFRPAEERRSDIVSVGNTW
ncbi:iron-sulfur cluster assembly protein [Maudiozyma humilis]|uniref:Cytosolic Fe-S cluster assembly factor NAR1 n=1 Tax=Maudiozyma humilis TaxID=51915 RepID=A0AAV5S5L1_MAUHU|nr:iron-sulfur cluster assembly protein [Kazachstania humilis]